MSKRDTSWSNTFAGFGRILTSKGFWRTMAIMALVVGAVTLISGCGTVTRLDPSIDGECRRLMQSDALDRASARRLGCYG